MTNYKDVIESIKRLMNTPEQVEAAKKQAKQAEEAAEQLVKSMRAKQIWRLFND